MRKEGGTRKGKKKIVKEVGKLYGGLMAIAFFKEDGSTWTLGG